MIDIMAIENHLSLSLILSAESEDLCSGFNDVYKLLSALFCESVLVIYI